MPMQEGDYKRKETKLICFLSERARIIFKNFNKFLNDKKKFSGTD